MDSVLSGGWDYPPFKQLWISKSIRKCPLALSPKFKITFVSEYRQLMSQSNNNNNNNNDNNSNNNNNSDNNNLLFIKCKITFQYDLMWSSSKDKQLLKIKLTCILTLLLEIGCKGSDFKGHFVLDVKWACMYSHFWT